ncbi:aspartyl-tRNA synthetase [Klebsiella pneumoniae]|uniref:Aspartyl-tRNA synthetase n=1 Tax=Klebsiella pneumoniae TaxID=573 RepID=A0A378BUL5_KLEPN|nr:aspartyl-tRNA synthetase [Klebsiella pneumoniae]
MVGSTARRDLGSLIFIDMRDREGIVQVFFDPDRADALKLASELRNEFCIQVTGTVRAREEKNINADMATGAIEVLASDLTIINRSESLPLDSNHVNTEEARLKYRYLDLRRPEMAQRLKTRAKITSFVRRFMDDHGFLDIETPMLTKATPEGAPRLPRAFPRAQRQILRAAAVAAAVQTAADDVRLRPLLSDRQMLPAMKTCVPTVSLNSPRSTWKPPL